MNDVEVIKQAIQVRRTIRFQYLKPGKTPGVRYGNAHALYYSPSNELMMDVFQLDGISDTPEEPFPKWRAFFVKFIQDTQMDEASFMPAPGYNPISPRYQNPFLLL